MHVPRAFLHAVVLVLAALSLDAAPNSPIQSILFAKKSGAAETMKFTAIPASESGLNVQNPYDDPAMWADRYTEFQGGSIGTGIAVGDLDGDGLVDIYVVNKTRPNQLFKQVAPFKFVDVTEQSGVGGPAAANGVGWKTGVTLADVNNDGFLDIYVCRFDAPNLLFVNDGHGHFTEQAHQRGLDLVSGSVVGAFEDYDRDGFLDLFVVTNIQDAKRSPDGEPDYLFHNRGDGTFEDVSAKAGIGRDVARGHSATWFDSNADGWPDLYVTNDFTKPDHLFRNNGDGTFTDVLPTAVSHTTWFSMGSDFGDINNDGLFDLFVAEMAGTTGKRSETMSVTLIVPSRSNSSAGSKRPQREPTRVSSFTIIAAVSIVARPCTVDFMITVPLGLAIFTAACSPSPEPVASTTQSYEAMGSRSPASSMTTPARSAMRSFSGCRPN